MVLGLSPLAKKGLESTPLPETSEVAKWLANVDATRLSESLRLSELLFNMDATQGSSVGESPPGLVKKLKGFLDEQPPPAGIYPAV